MYCERELKKATQVAEKKSVNEISQFQKYKKRKIAEQEAKGEDRGDEEEFGAELRAELESLKGKLMDIEMSLNQVLAAAIEVFRERVKGNIEQAKTATEDFFKIVAAQVEEYQRELRIFAIQKSDDFINNAAANENAEEEEDDGDEEK